MRAVSRISCSLVVRSLTEDVEILFKASIKFQFKALQMSIPAFGICYFSIFTHGSNIFVFAQI